MAPTPPFQDCATQFAPPFPAQSPLISLNGDLPGHLDRTLDDEEMQRREASAPIASTLLGGWTKRDQRIEFGWCGQLVARSGPFWVQLDHSPLSRFCHRSLLSTSPGNAIAHPWDFSQPPKPDSG